MKVETEPFNWTRAETEDFVRRMKPAEAYELLGETGLGGTKLADGIETDVLDTWERGSAAFGVRLDGIPCAVFAAAPDSALAESATVWLISSRECEAHRTVFGRRSLRCFRDICAALPHIKTFWNYAPETNCSGDTREWLAWLGAWFSASEKWRSPWTGETFGKFYIPAYEGRA